MNVVHYADDSTMNMIGDSFDSLMCKTNFELGRIDNLLCANKLFLNKSKTQFCILNNIHYNNSSALQIRGLVLPHFSHIKV